MFYNCVTSEIKTEIHGVNTKHIKKRNKTQLFKKGPSFKVTHPPYHSFFLLSYRGRSIEEYSRYCFMVFNRSNFIVFK